MMKPHRGDDGSRRDLSFASGWGLPSGLDEAGRASPAQVSGQQNSMVMASSSKQPIPPVLWGRDSPAASGCDEADAGS